MSDINLIVGQEPEYSVWLVDLKRQIHEAQTRAVLAVNSELVHLYWQIGREILDRQERQAWGSKIVDQLATDLRNEFPDMKGFSTRNLKYMRAFAEAWKDNQFVQEVLAQLPWSHQIALLDKLKSNEDRLWYADAAIKNGWSRNVLVIQIESQLHLRQGSALTNFSKTLPAAQAEIAQSIIKDPVILNFIELDASAHELEIERALVAKVQDFMMEVGHGFAFIGRQYHLEVGGQDFFLDLLFYNVILHAYVVIDLKIDDFKPEYAGKMQFYLAMVDEKMKTDVDNPSIGLILCKSKNGIIVEYALRDSSKPMGVAEYKFTQLLPSNLTKAIPNLAQIESAFMTGDEDQSNSHNDDSSTELNLGM